MDKAPISHPPRPFDVSKPVLVIVGALLAIMIVLPMGWLVVYAFATKDGQATLGNFVTLFTDPSFVDPLLATLLLSEVKTFKEDPAAVEKQADQIKAQYAKYFKVRRRLRPHVPLPR